MMQVNKPYIVPSHEIQTLFKLILEKMVLLNYFLMERIVTWVEQKLVGNKYNKLFRIRTIGNMYHQPIVIWNVWFPFKRLIKKKNKDGTYVLEY